MQNLLDGIFAIEEKDKQELKESAGRGELFSIFDVLGWRTDEVKTHSSFIVGLLDSQGNHACGDKFLQAFLNVIECNDIKLDVRSAKVCSEYNTGPINKKKTEGGILDIIIESEDKAIIIENKIYAGDQKNQLLRYQNYAKKKYKKYYLLYLTLDGHSPSEDSAPDDVKYYCINYRDDILPWLAECVKISEGKPVVQKRSRNMFL